MEEKHYCYGATYAICLTIVPFCVSDGKKTLKRSASYEIDEGTKKKQVKIAPKIDLSSFGIFNDSNSQSSILSSSNMSSSQVNCAGYRTVSECLRNNGDLRSNLSHFNIGDSGIDTENSVRFEQSMDTKNFAATEERSRKITPRKSRRKQKFPKNEEEEPFESCFTEDSGIEGILHGVKSSLRSPVRVVLRTPPKATDLSTFSPITGFSPDGMKNLFTPPPQNKNKYSTPYTFDNLNTPKNKMQTPSKCPPNTHCSNFSSIGASPALKSNSSLGNIPMYEMNGSPYLHQGGSPEGLGNSFNLASDFTLDNMCMDEPGLLDLSFPDDAFPTIL